jgi:copper transport protein
MLRLIVLLLFAVAALCPGAAWAHAALVHSDPADGQVLSSAPSVVHLRFNEPVSPLVVRLFDAVGGTHTDLVVKRHDDMVMVTMPQGLRSGTHVLSYRVTSSDGHPVAGSLTFSIGAPSALAASGTGDERAGRALWLARLILYLGLSVGAGGVFFLTWLAPEPIDSSRAPAPFLAAGLVSAAVSLGLQGLDARGAALPALADRAVWVAGASTAYGLTAAASVGALMMGWLALHIQGKLLRRALGLGALFGAGIAPALSGHAGTAAPQWLTRSAVAVHGVGVAYWIGALVPLAVALLQLPQKALPTVRRFSTIAIAVVGVLTLSGLLLAWIQVESPENLLATSYGQVLVAKVVLVGALLCLAALNRLWLTPAFARTDRSGKRWLVRSVAAEFVLAAAILGVVGLWRFTPPPRALAAAAQAAATASVHLHSSRIMAQVTLSPGKAGPARASVALALGQDMDVDPKEVTLILSKPETGIEPLERKARKAGRSWEVGSVFLPTPGPWQVKVEILIDDFEKATLEGSIVVRPSLLPP